LAESLVLIEFIADLFPDSDLLPKDPVERAKVRFFIDTVSTKLTPALNPYSTGGSAMLEAVDLLQQQIQGKYVLGDRFTLADVAIAPFLGRSLLIALKNGIGKFDKEDAEKAWTALNGTKYEKFWRYFNDVQARPSWKNTFDEVRPFYLFYSIQSNVGVGLSSPGICDEIRCHFMNPNVGYFVMVVY
jgi:glutathione S-transferase